ncbi:MAG: baseplate J/gp47 family protein [Lachnospiraceae bacterium]|nr:baseplate J/gp47 family protein [Lachnospiraceae bacterium]
MGLYEDVTPESLKEQILGEITKWDTREGSFADILISPTAYVLWQTIQSLNSILPIAFVDETSGQYIDKRSGEFGIYRKEGTKARVLMQFTGTEGTAISAGNVVLDGDGYEYIVESTITVGSDGTGTGYAEAADVGDSYNAESNTITLQYKNISGITAVTNPEAATGGTDEETDSALVQRLYDYWQTPTTSGNIYHYKKWALEVDGVGAAKIFPLWNGNGTVKVVVSDSSMLPASESIVEACAAYIEEVRPIGATVTVESASQKDIVVNAVLQMDQSRTLADVKADIETAIEAYIKSMAFEATTLLYNRIAYIILGIEGVVDYTSLTLNDSSGNVAIADNEVAVLTGCEVSE